MAFFVRLLTVLTFVLSFVVSLPNLPLSTSGRWIIDSNGKTVTYAGVNWPGHMAAMIPEGLQYQSIESIVGKIKSLGMNSIRLTYATELVDTLLDRGNLGDVPIRDTLVKALGQSNGSEVFKKILKNNPQFSEQTTRLQVWEARRIQNAYLLTIERYLTQLLQNAIKKGYTFTWTTTSLKHCGAATRRMGIHGRATDISIQRSGSEDGDTWRITYYYYVCNHTRTI
jgi:hypothetical protein